MAPPLLLRKYSEKGMVLLSSLAILLGLMLVGLGAGTMLQNDFRVTANLKGSTEAFYHSSAGLELGKKDLSLHENFPPAPANRSMSFSSGSFAVSFHKPTIVGPLSARVVLRSVGTSGSAKHLIEAQLTKTYDLADAALVLRGSATAVHLGVSDISISGADHSHTGARIPNASSRSAVSTGDEAIQSHFARAIEARPGIVDTGNAAEPLAVSEYLPSTLVSRFADELCASPTAVVHPMPNEGMLTFENQVWGTHGAPQLHCIEGRTDSGDAVTFAGNVSGVGILVVKNADLVLSGGFRWDGLVVVTGTEVSFRTTGEDLKQLLGAAVVNETGNPGILREIVEIHGAVRIAFSRWALDQTVSLIPVPVLAATRSGLPAALSQNYWRAEAG